MVWKTVQAGLDAVKKASARPPPKPFPDWVYAYTIGTRKRLEGRRITLEGRVKARHPEETTFNAATVIYGVRHPLTWQKVRDVQSVGSAKELQKKLGKLQNRASYVC